MNKHYRPEIDGLRAIAVIAVIIYHFYHDYLPQGYLGVDVFFVISGYVITAYFYRAEKTSLSKFFVVFYSRRIKRLLPALLVCVLITAGLFVFVTSRPPLAVFTTGAAAILGFSNIYLHYLSLDYFSLNAQLNPFMQTWSLGVEEQFYLIYPALFAAFGFAWKSGKFTDKKIILLLSVISGISFLSFVYLVYLGSDFAFYMMPTRFWELAIGGLVFYQLKNSGHSGNAGVAWVATFGLIVAFTAPGLSQSIYTALAVMCTALIIYSIRPATKLYNLLTLKPMISIGRISYSLYLWHWSILILGKWTIGDTFAASLVMLVLTFVMSILSYYLVEKPIRNTEFSFGNIFTILTGILFAVLCALFIRYTVYGYSQSYNNNLPKLFGVTLPAKSDVACHGAAKIRKMKNYLPTCLGAERTSSKPNIIYLLGDSHAARLTFMVSDAVKDQRFTTRFVNSEAINDFPYGVINGVEGSDIIEYVVENSIEGDILALTFHRGRVSGGRAKKFISGMKPYLDQLAAKNVKIILIQDTPLMGVVSTSGACMLQLKLFGKSICRINKKQNLQNRAPQDLAFTKLTEQYSNITMWDPNPYIFKGKDYIEVADENDRYIMMDWNHITEYQSRKLAPEFEKFLRKNFPKENP